MSITFITYVWRNVILLCNGGFFVGNYYLDVTACVETRPPNQAVATSTRRMKSQRF